MQGLALDAYPRLRLTIRRVVVFTLGIVLLLGIGVLASLMMKAKAFYEFPWIKNQRHPLAKRANGRPSLRSGIGIMERVCGLQNPTVCKPRCDCLRFERRNRPSTCRPARSAL